MEDIIVVRLTLEEIEVLEDWFRSDQRMLKEEIIKNDKVVELEEYRSTKQYLDEVNRTAESLKKVKIEMRKEMLNEAEMGMNMNFCELLEVIRVNRVILINDWINNEYKKLTSQEIHQLQREVNTVMGVYNRISDKL